MANGEGRNMSGAGANPPAGGTGGATSSSGSGNANAPPQQRFGHGSKESDVGHVNGAFAMAQRAERERSAAGNVRVVRRDEGGKETIAGETVAEMRARVARERAAAGPTDFQRSMLGRVPGQSAPGAGFADTAIGTQNEGTATGGTGMAGGTGAGSIGGGVGATAIPGTGGTGTAAR